MGLVCFHYWLFPWLAKMNTITSLKSRCQHCWHHGDSRFSISNTSYLHSITHTWINQETGTLHVQWLEQLYVWKVCFIFWRWHYNLKLARIRKISGEQQHQLSTFGARMWIADRWIDIIETCFVKPRVFPAGEICFGMENQYLPRTTYILVSQ